MPSASECTSISEAVQVLNQALDSLLSLHREGVEVQPCVLAVTEALEKLEDLLPEEFPEPAKVKPRSQMSTCLLPSI